MATTRLISTGVSAYGARDMANSAICQLCSAEFSKRSRPSGRFFLVTPFSLSSSRMKSAMCCMGVSFQRGLIGEDGIAYTFRGTHRNDSVHTARHEPAFPGVPPFSDQLTA